MNPQQQLLDYIKAQHLQGTDPAALKQQLVQIGWHPQQVDEALRQVAQQYRQAMPPAAAPTPGATGGKKPHPPIAAQILYALGFLGLIFGLFVAVMLFIGTSSSSLQGIGALFGISGFTFKATAVMIGAITIGLFVLINYIRARKKWALIAYTTVVSLGFISTLYDVLTRSEIEKLLSNRSPFTDLLFYIVLAPLLITLWTRNRKDFY